jgi:hypothetical protein
MQENLIFLSALPAVKLVAACGSLSGCRLPAWRKGEVTLIKIFFFKLTMIYFFLARFPR